jgi:DNA (cytosine-5)-methyltransferase 1
MVVVDLFAGPGGTDEGLRALGIAPIGLELDKDACATGRAAGHRREQVDVSTVDPREFGPLDGMAASAPCQAFSAAGRGEGRRALVAYQHAISDWLKTGVMPDRAALDAICGDDRAHLVLEPLRWALAANPTWIFLEQVPPVLPIWKYFAGFLRVKGWHTATGLVSAERHGVPQTRVRAILIAHRDKPVTIPAPTHQRYVTPRRRHHGTDTMFDVLPERIVHPADRALQPWISMAEALGFGMPHRPYPPLGCSSPTGGADVEKVGGSGARRLIREAYARGWWITDTGYTRGTGQIAAPGRTRDGDEPAPAITTRADQLEVRTLAYERRQTRCPDRPITDPAPTITANGISKHTDRWIFTRPATTVQGDPRIAPPGHHDRQMKDAIRIDITDALLLQSFRHDYPVQGSKASTFRQVGNAVPPDLATAMIRPLVS